MATLSLGVITGMGPEPEQNFDAIRAMELTTCQLCSWAPMEITPELAARTRAAAEAAGITISLFWCGYRGRLAWDYRDGPATIGLVPPETRAERTADLMRGAEIAHWLGVTEMATHVGFLPPNPHDADYRGTVAALQEIAACCAEHGVTFNFETGQETPMVLLRCIQDIGADNLGINLDPANLLMYGNANPLDALDVFGQYIRGVHAKDGDYPRNGYELGPEMPLGEGRVNFPALVPKLKALGYRGPLTIEREISGPQQVADIRRAMALLEPLL